MRRTDGRLRFGLTDAGSVVLRGTAFVALAALFVPAFGALSALVSVVLMALLVGFVVRPKIQLSGGLPDSVMAGQTVPLRYALKNVGRRPSYDLGLSFGALPEAIEQIGGGPIVSRLGPGDTIEVTIAIRPKHRGCYRIKQPICQSVFPFKLFSFGRSRDDEEILIVLPAFSELQIPLRRPPNPSPVACRPSEEGRETSNERRGTRGACPEYLGNRPFLPGDSPRRIDARAWARLSVPATKEYDDDFDPDFVGALVLDTAVSDARGPTPVARDPSEEGRATSDEREAAISLCASVAYTINRDCLIDFLLVGRDLHQFTGWPPDKSGLRLKKIHEILAGLEPFPACAGTAPAYAGGRQGYSADQIAPILEDRFYEISEVFFILLKWDAAYRQLLELAEAAGCRTRVLLIGQSSRMHVDKDSMNGTGDIQFLSSDEILAGRIKRL